MLSYLIRRVLIIIPTLFLISVTTYAIIELPPGDYISRLRLQMISAAASGGGAEATDVVEQRLESLRQRYAFDKPWYVRYWKWISHFVRGDMGMSMSYTKPVKQLIGERLGITFLLSIYGLLFTWLVAIPVGVVLALNRNSTADYAISLLTWFAASVPAFVLALGLMWWQYTHFGGSVGGLFSPQYMDQPWSWGKFVDMLKHIWIPVIIMATAGIAGAIKGQKAVLLDEINKPYVMAARAKGLPEAKLVLKYPFKIAMNPTWGSIGGVLAGLFSGEAIMAMVLNLQTVGPVVVSALRDQDMFLAGSYLFLISILTVLGVLISDIVLAIMDPRIRYE